MPRPGNTGVARARGGRPGRSAPSAAVMARVTTPAPVASTQATAWSPVAEAAREPAQDRRQVWLFLVVGPHPPRRERDGAAR